jgi:hypothetical protein
MHLLGKFSIDDLRLKDIDNFEYSPFLPENQWKVYMVKEIIDVQADQLNVENFSRKEFEEKKLREAEFMIGLVDFILG